MNSRHRRVSVNSILLSVVTLVLVVVAADNVAYEWTANDEVSYRRTERHSAYTDVTHTPPVAYRRISELSLYDRAVRFRTGTLGNILPNGGGGDCRVFFIGGSTTEAHWMPEDRRWPYLVGQEQHLRALVTTYNFGVGGYNLHQNLVKYLTVLMKEKPQVVVVMHGINDVGKMLNGGYYAQERTDLYNSYAIDHSKRSISERFKDLLKAVLPATYAIYRLRRNDSGDPRAVDASVEGGPATVDQSRFDVWMRESVAEYRLRLHLLNQAVRGAGGVLVVMTQPNRSEDMLRDDSYASPAKAYLRELIRGKGFSEAQYLDSVNTFSETAREFAGSENVDLIDLAASFKRSSESMYDTIHYTPTGSVEIGRLVSSALRPVVRATCGARPAADDDVRRQTPGVPHGQSLAAFRAVGGRRDPTVNR